MQYEELPIFCYALCVNGQPWIRKFVILRFKILHSIPSHMEQTASINESKYVIKTCKPDLCSCRLCKDYLQNIGCL